VNKFYLDIIRMIQESKPIMIKKKCGDCGMEVKKVKNGRCNICRELIIDFREYRMDKIILGNDPKDT